MPIALRERSDAAAAPPPHSETAASDIYGGRYEALGDWFRAYWRATGLVRKAVYSAVVENSARRSDAYAELLVQQSEVAETLLERTRRYLAAYDSSARHIFAETAAIVRSDTLLRPARERLAQISRLEADWDSYGAEPPSAAAVLRANSLLQAVEESLADLVGEQIRPYALAPIADGGVQLEWRGQGKTLEIEIGPDRDLGYLLIEEDGDARSFQQEDNVSTSQIVELVAKTLID